MKLFYYLTHITRLVSLEAINFKCFLSEEYEYESELCFVI